LSKYDALPAPIITNAVFSNDGGSIVVSFDSKTDKGGYVNSFPCFQLLNFSSSFDMENWKCFWQDDMTMNIYPVGKGGLLPELGDAVFVISGKIRAQCDDSSNCATLETVKDTFITLSSTKSVNSPIVVLQSPARLIIQPQGHQKVLLLLPHF
jgi:hypothetical protein